MVERPPFEQRFEALWPPMQWQPVGVLVAVSGGADSVALLRAMRAICDVGAAGLQAAHLNHGLRGPEADGDQQFVVDLCRRLEVPCHVQRVDVAAEANRGGESLETAGRLARYRFLQHTAEAQAARYVATAHTADDQAETILHRVIRGTSVAGLAGMRRARPLGPAATLIRPLLSFHRAELIAYLGELRQPFRQDSSNIDPRFMRSRIRHELLPLLREKYNSGVDEALLRLGSLAAQASQVIAPLVEQLGEGLLRTDPVGSAVIDCARLGDADQHLVREMLVALWRRQNWPQQAMGLAEWDRLRELIQNPPPGRAARCTLPGGIDAQRDGDQLTLTAPSAWSTAGLSLPAL